MTSARSWNVLRLWSTRAGLERRATPLLAHRGPPDVAWVFDQAPVSVTPTDNVAGQVRLRRPARTSSCDDPWLLDQLSRATR